MLTTIKSFYSRLITLLAFFCWIAFFLYFGFNGGLIFLPASMSTIAISLLIVIMLPAATWLLWPKLSHLRDEKTVNSSKATIGVFLITVALIAFPGTFVGPMAIAAWSGQGNIAMNPYFSLFFGFPIFIALSLIGFILVFSSRNKGNA